MAVAVDGSGGFGRYINDGMPRGRPTHRSGLRRPAAARTAGTRALKTPKTPKPEETKSQSRPSGGVRHDERGHAVWQWASDTARNAINSTSALLRKLEVPGLSLQDDPPPASTSTAKRAAETQGYTAFNGKRTEAVKRPAAAPAGLDWICVSPKADAPLAQTRGQELKLVFPQPGVDPDRFLGLNFERFLLQPMDGPDREAATRAAVAYCLAHPAWRLSVQTHKYLGLP